ncbi:adult-specific cuticular protein ACP-20-like [Diorhabda sublineata]|uniref:adult-specific cuticular protein ACP-20-like n=1 Tax=Diorhabda sublineata TaxID=1163346 RepID=UPI0024E06212|nr:adult-specific cuticular protein ACP-20-like [Diorhabda sublineata]
MFAKIAVLALLCGMSSSGHLDISPYHGAAPYDKVIGIYDHPYGGNIYGNRYEKDYDHYHYPKYEYSYGVHDPHTGDQKSQHEERDGDVVKGYYTVADPDGTLRTVHYTADDHNGFNAVVQKDGHQIHPQIYGKVIAEPILTLIAVAAVAQAGVLNYSHGQANAQSGDHKSQHEVRDGGVVKGSYTVAESDGTIRTVHYTADDHNGFNAVVEKSGHPVHPAPAYGKTILADPSYHH